MQETINQRVKNLLKILNATENSVASQLGMKQSTLNSALNAKSDNISSKILDGIVTLFPEINAHWLLTGEGDMIGKPQSLEKPQTPEISYTEGVPYYDEDFLLGFSEMIPTGHEHPEYLIKMPGYEKATLWCNASGHSMEPEINNGDIIALKRIDDFSFLPFGDIYGIITTNGLRTIKRLGKSSKEGCYRLIPTNADYDSQDIPISKIAIVYRVMGAMKAF